MNLDDRIRQELHRRSADIDIEAAGPRHVVASARARTRRTRIVGGVAVGLFLLGVGGAAIALRDGGGTGEQIQTAAAGEDSVGDTGDGAATDDATDSAAGADPGADAEELATTEAAESSAEATQGDPADDNDDAPAAAAADPADDGDGNNDGDAPETSDDPPVAPATDTEFIDVLAHGDGFVALQPSGALEFSTDGATWRRIADPKPNGRSSITSLASHGGVLYAAGDRPGGGTVRPWVAATADLSTWDEVSVPTAPDTRSELTTSSTRLYSLAAGPAGLLATGETIIDLEVEELLPAEVLASGAWSLGNSVGDLSKVIVYDADGAVEREIDLLAAGVAQSTIDRWEDGTPIPFIATGTGDGLEMADPDLSPGTILTNSLATDDGFAAAGFSGQFSSRIVWQSPDGSSWTGAPVGVVANEQADMLGVVNGRLTVFASTGPILTVQQLRGENWREARLDPLFGNANDQYLLVDASFDDSGAVAVFETVGQSGNTKLWFASSDNGLDWSVESLDTVLADAAVGVDSLSIAAGSVVIGYETVTGDHQVTLLDL